MKYKGPKFFHSDSRAVRLRHLLAVWCNDINNKKSLNDVTSCLKWLRTGRRDIPNVAEKTSFNDIFITC